MSRTGEYIRTKSRLGLIMDGGWCGDRGWKLTGIEFLVWCDKKRFYNWLWRWLYINVNRLKPTELYTWNGWIVDISSKLFQKKEKNIMKFIACKEQTVAVGERDAGNYSLFLCFVYESYSTVWCY